MGVAVIMDKYSALGLRLAGVDDYPADTPDKAVEKFNEIVEKNHYKIIIVSERFFKAVSQAKAKKLGEELFPIISALPDMSGPTGERVKMLYENISRAVGAKLKLGE
ncbi:MAG: hypothetical protein DRN81_01775 [Thermoproteota archaeon]|nr:MAG: hypothetical protein DRN81_01775 [Candidatus Korarchaeota archaeon]